MMYNSQNSNDWDFFESPSNETYQPKRTVEKRKKTRRPLPKPWMVIIALVLLSAFLLEQCNNNTDNQIIRKEDGEQIKQDESDLEGAEDDVSDEFQYYYYTQLTETDQQTYNTILDTILNMNSKCEIQITDKDTLGKIIEGIRSDHPELFWIDGAYTTTTYNDYMEFSPTYLYGKNEKITRQKQIDEQANSILAQIQTNWSDYEKIKFVFEQIIIRVDYITGAPDNQNIYSSLVNKQSVCAGYARACQYLLQKMGIECLFVSGMVNGTESHAWNIVKCNGNYYHLDATFGDRAFETNIQSNMPEEFDINYGYLCCSDQEMYGDRYSDMVYKLPTCNLIDLNYFKMQGRYYEYYSDAILDIVEESVYKGEKMWQCQFSNPQDYQSMLNVIKNGAYSDIVGRYKNSIGDNNRFTAWYLEDNSRYTISCWY